MERMTISIPKAKRALIIALLKELGVTIQVENPSDSSDFRRTLANVSVWSEDDLKVFEKRKTAYENFKPKQ